MPAIRRILCPTDFSSTSQQSRKYADEFAASNGAELLLLHAFDNPSSFDPKGQRIPADLKVVERLDSIESQHEDVQVHRMLHAGPAGQVICWAAENQACDLIIMGTHGRTGLKHLLFGSTAEYVLKHARCPVLTIREQPDHSESLAEPIVAPIPAPRYM